MAGFFNSRGCLPPPILAGCFRLPLPPAEKRIYRTRDININSNLRTCRCRCLDARSTERGSWDAKVAAPDATYGVPA